MWVLVTCIGIALPALGCDEQARSPQQLSAIARSITVKVLVGKTWGSGVLIEKREGTYLVITNRHVLNRGDTYQVQTEDSEVHPATLQKIDWQSNDLGLLQFRSDRHYAIAEPNMTKTLKIGDEVFAAGFPIAQSSFQFVTGKISLLPLQPIEAGYQIAHSSPVQIGMSGGALLDCQGQIVGINGMSSYPLWGNPYIFQDGSLPDPTTRSIMQQFNWAIPVQTFWQNRRSVSDLKSKLFSHINSLR